MVDRSIGHFIHDTGGNDDILIVRSSALSEVSGPGVAVNVKSDPYLINFCYGEQTSIRYTLDREAEVTITLFPLDQDVSSPDAVILVDHETQSAGEHTASWEGTDAADVRHVLFSREGLYSFVIEATVDNITGTARGVVSLYK